MFRLCRNGSYRAVLSLLCFVFGVGCSSHEPASPTATDGGATATTDGAATATTEDPEKASDSAITGTCAQNCPDCKTGAASALFDWKSVPTFDIKLPENRWTYLQTHALEEQYEPACVTFEGKPVGTVGLRFKGSYATLESCVDAQGKLTCNKLSMKVKFDDVDKKQRFYGLKRLNFHAMIYDGTKIRERLAYDLFRDMGIMSPRSAWANITVNGKSYGLFSMIEQVDGRFTEDRWPSDPDGDLYKEAWPGFATELSYYESHLDTDVTKASPNSFVKFASALAAAKSNELATELAKWADTDYLARYMAVDDAIFDADGITRFGISEDGIAYGNHNFYFYKEKTRDFFWLIPWDLDITFDSWPAFSRIPRWDVVPEDCSRHYPTLDTIDLVTAPGCDRFFQAIAANRQAYKKALGTLLSGPFAQATILAKIDKFSSFVAGAVKADPLGEGTVAWDQSIAELKKVIPILYQRLEHIRDGQFIVPFDLSISTVNRFEETDDFGLQIGTTLLINSASTASRSITQSNPLEGARGIQLDFEYRDEQNPWEQGLDFNIPLVQGMADVSKMTGIRLWAKSDQERALRLDLTSPANSAEDSGIRKGWDVEVGPEASEIEVVFSEAETPDWARNEGLDPKDPLSDVLRSVTGISFQPECLGMDLSGFLGKGITDKGFLEIDAIEFFTE